MFVVNKLFYPMKIAQTQSKLVECWCNFMVTWPKKNVDAARLCDPQGCDLNAFGQLIDDDSEVHLSKRWGSVFWVWKTSVWILY